MQYLKLESIEFRGCRVCSIGQFINFVRKQKRKYIRIFLIYQIFSHRNKELKSKKSDSDFSLLRNGAMETGKQIFFSSSSKQGLDPIFVFFHIFKPSKKGSFRIPQFKKEKSVKKYAIYTSSLHATSADHSAAYRLSSNHMMMDHDIPSSNIECAN